MLTQHHYANSHSHFIHSRLSVFDRDTRHSSARPSFFCAPGVRCWNGSFRDRRIVRRHELWSCVAWRRHLLAQTRHRCFRSYPGSLACIQCKLCPRRRRELSLEVEVDSRHACRGAHRIYRGLPQVHLCRIHLSGECGSVVASLRLAGAGVAVLFCLRFCFNPVQP